MLQDTHDISKPVGLKMHLGNTKVMCNKHVNKHNVIVDGKKIKEVDKYVSLGLMVTKDYDQLQKKWKGESDSNGVHSASWTAS